MLVRNSLQKAKKFQIWTNLDEGQIEDHVMKKTLKAATKNFLTQWMSHTVKLYKINKLY